jgi:hypothetical protein
VGGWGGEDYFVKPKRKVNGKADMYASPNFADIYAIDRKRSIMP